jgi:hypothetical protein
VHGKCWRITRDETVDRGLLWIDRNVWFCWMILTGRNKECLERQLGSKQWV